MSVDPKQLEKIKVIGFKVTESELQNTIYPIMHDCYQLGIIDHDTLTSFLRFCIQFWMGHYRIKKQQFDMVQEEIEEEEEEKLVAIAAEEAYEKNSTAWAIEKATDALKRLTYVILGILRIESQSLKVEMERLNLNGIILTTIEDYSDQLAGNDVNLLYWPDRQKTSMFRQTEKERMMQLGSTLLGNALKFTESGTVTITTQRNSENIVVVTVQNTSTGI
jgi:signal transduction histidine kinase